MPTQETWSECVFLHFMSPFVPPHLLYGLLVAHLQRRRWRPRL